MNIYLVVEGRVGEKRVYGFWVPLVNPALKIISNMEDVTQDCVYIISGDGSNYFDVISDGIADVETSGLFDRLVIAVDSEDMSYDEKKVEIRDLCG